MAKRRKAKRLLRRDESGSSFASFENRNALLKQLKQDIRYRLASPEPTTAQSLGVPQYSRERELWELRHGMLDRARVSTLQEFNQALDEYADKVVPAELVNFQTKVALGVLSGVVLKTPVDTGRARGNWQTSIGTPIEEEGWIESPTMAGAAVMKTLTPFNVVFISNNVPYIIYLEDGSSDQAPAGMVTVTMAEMAEQYEAA